MIKMIRRTPELLHDVPLNTKAYYLKHGKIMVGKVVNYWLVAVAFSNGDIVDKDQIFETREKLQKAIERVLYRVNNEHRNLTTLLSLCSDLPNDIENLEEGELKYEGKSND